MIVDCEGMVIDFLARLHDEGRDEVTILQTKSVSRSLLLFRMRSTCCVLAVQKVPKYRDSLFIPGQYNTCLFLSIRYIMDTCSYGLALVK